MAYGNSVSFNAGVDKAGSQHPAITALRFYTDFAQPTKDIYTWNDKMGNAFDEFARGKTVFYFGFAYEYPRLKTRAPQIDVEVLPMLQLNDKQPVNIANYWVESVVKKSKHQNEAWEFVAFMTKADNIKNYTAATHRPTPLRAQIKTQSEDLTLAPFASQILNAENWYRGSNIKAASDAFDYMINTYLQPVSGEKSQMQRDRELLNYTARLVQQTM
jgi:ABC-type glycerol-3-phosphate transport system substrate-binding protein